MRRLARRGWSWFLGALQLDCARSTSSIRILVVEDDALVSRAISRVLLRIGCEVIAAPSCLAVRALACRFDAGVFDVGLSDGCGVELARSLLDSGHVESVVFFTGELSPTALARARRLGPVVKKSEGVEALAPLVLGLMGDEGARPSGIVCKHDQKTAGTPRRTRGAGGAA